MTDSSGLKACPCPLCGMEIKRINDDLFRHLSYVDVEKGHTTSCPLAGFQFPAAALPFWNRRHELLSSPRPEDGEAVEAARRIMKAAADYIAANTADDDCLEIHKAYDDALKSNGVAVARALLRSKEV